MKLSKEYKDRIRLAYTGKLIEYIQSGKYEIFGKIKLNKDILEDLLFDTVKVKRKDISYTVKLPVWSGRFLEVLDLSEVDFSNVSWSLLCCENYRTYFDKMFDIYNYSVEYANKFTKINDSFIKFHNQLFEEYPDYFSPYRISFSGTNANIDLSQSFEAKVLDLIGLTECDFHDFNFVDYTQASIIDKPIKYLIVVCSDLSGSNIKITSDIGLLAKRSVFDGIDLSFKKINASYSLVNDFTYTGHLPFCSLRDTRIQINLSSDDFKLDKSDEQSVKINCALETAIKKDYWAGCYVNGKLFDSCEERAKRKARIKEEFDSLANSKISELYKSVDK